MRPSKKNQIILEALNIFYQVGFQAAGVDFIVNHTGISKTTIYNHFESKEALILAVLDKRDSDFRSWLSQRVDELADSPETKLFCVFDALDEWFQQEDFKGCMFIRASSEYQELDGPIFKQSALHKERLKIYFHELASKANCTNPMAVANQMLILKEGAIIAANLKLMSSPGSHAKEILTALI